VRRTLVFVLGMHRSGTSAVTGALAALGAALPGDLLPPKDDNPRGFFESERLLALHDDLLTALDRSWDDVTPLPSGWVGHPAVDAFVAGARALLDELPDRGVVAIKDPRLCRVLPAWRQRVLRPDERAVGLLVTRPGTEVVASLVRREGMPAEAAWLLLALHLTEALDAVTDLATATVSYPAVLDGWEAELRPALELLGLADLARPDRGADVAGFLSADLRHEPSPEVPLGPTIARVRDAVDDVVRTLDGARPALSPLPDAGLASAVAAATDLTALGAGPPRRILGEHVARERALADEVQQLTEDRDRWQAAHDRQVDALARARAELETTRTLLEETQQARSLRMARWLRSLAPGDQGTADGP
jgi:hypothetical protein